MKWLSTILVTLSLCVSALAGVVVDGQSAAVATTPGTVQDFSQVAQLLVPTNPTSPESAISLNYFITHTGGGVTNVAWGVITGSLSAQTDLWTALTSRYTKVEADALFATTNYVHAQGFLTSFTETDPVWSGVSNQYATTNYVMTRGFLTSYSETDPVWSGVSNQYATTNWVIGQGYLTSFTETDPIWSGVSNQYATTNYVMTRGFLTSYSETDPVWGGVSNQYASTNYVMTRGFLTSYTETDPVALLALTNHIANWKASLDPIGVVDAGQWTLSFSNATRTFYLTPVGASADYFYQGTKVTKTNVTSVTIGTNATMHFIWFNDASGVLTNTTTAWGFSNAVQIATVLWDPVASNGWVGNELHGIDFPWSVHELMHATVGTRYASGFGATFSATNFTLTAGVIYDEDIKFSIPATNRCSVFYRANSVLSWVPSTNVVYLTTGGFLAYDNGTNLTQVGNNNYAAMWVYAGNGGGIMTLVGQRQDTTLAAARTNNTPDTLIPASVPSQELKLLYRVIFHRTGSNVIYDETQDYRAVSSVSVSSLAPTAHSSLAGLSADDHPQYLLVTDAATTYTTFSNLSDSAVIATNVPVTLGTATVTRILGDTLALQLTQNTALTVATNQWTTDQVGRFSMDLYIGTNSLAWDTNAITGSSSVTLVTNDWNQLFFRKGYGKTTWGVVK